MTIRRSGEQLVSTIDEVIANQHLLKHSFYRRWVDGTLTRGELREYAKQYFHFERCFPRVLSAVHSQLGSQQDRQIVLQNLMDEELPPEPHTLLWIEFAESLGLKAEEVMASLPNQSTINLMARYMKFGRSSASEGLAALYAYESQVPAIAQAKLQGLALHYGINNSRFWEVHREVDTAHAGAERQLLVKYARNGSVAAAVSSLISWHEFLSGVESVPA